MMLLSKTRFRVRPQLCTGHRRVIADDHHALNCKSEPWDDIHIDAYVLFTMVIEIEAQK